MIYIHEILIVTNASSMLLAVSLLIRITFIRLQRIPTVITNNASMKCNA